MKYLLLVCMFVMPAHADSLDDALKCGIKLYADTQPPAGEWAKQLVNELEEDADRQQVVRLTAVKYWMHQNQRKDGNPVRPERIGTLSNAVQSCLAVLPDQEVVVGELVAKAKAILLAMYPSPPPVDAETLRALQLAHEQRRARLSLFRQRAEAAAQIVLTDFADQSEERQREIFLAAVALLRDEVDPT